MIRRFKVGGAVRDSFRGVEPKDIDYAIEAPSYQEMKEYVLSLGTEIFVEHPEFVTIRGFLNKTPCDFILCRKEGEYHDNRHPSSCEPGSIIEDLSRRDFTMNAIAIDCDSGEVIDPFGGRLDIAQHTIRCVGNAYDRFKEDALRIIRALRFSVTFGYTMSFVTEAAVVDLIHLLENISTERIRDEMMKMFKHDTIQSMRTLYNLLGNQGLSYIFNEKTKLWLLPTMKDK